MKDKLLIIGAGGHGRVIADIALRMNRWKSIAFLDDDETIKSSMGFKVIGKSSEAFKYIEDCEFFVGIGNNAVREMHLTKLESMGADIQILIHPSAVIGEQVEIKAGTVAMAGVMINCRTKIGKGCIINTGSTVDHDNVIEDYVHISPGVHLGGEVKVGNRTWLCIGSIVSNNVNITEGCIIGAGSVVITDINEAGTYIGVPARKVNK